MLSHNPSFNKKRRPAGRRAITLVESLVAIAIIGIVVALLLVGIGKVRETANRTACQKNLQQVALALQNYATDHGRLPEGSQNGALPWGAPRLTWIVPLLPYLDQTGVFGHFDVNASPPSASASPSASRRPARRRRPTARSGPTTPTPRAPTRPRRW